MKVTGTIQIEGEDPISINGHGLRDHAWGPRYWQSIPSYRWITGNYGDDLGMVLSIVGERKGDKHVAVGKVKGFIPFRNRRSEQITCIGEGMTEYTFDGDRIGYGLSEFLDQPDDTM
jgi:hypothetical protein